jgi:hypothetical protein
MFVDAQPIPFRRECPGGTRHPPVVTATARNVTQKSTVAVRAWHIPGHHLVAFSPRPLPSSSHSIYRPFLDIP